MPGRAIAPPDRAPACHCRATEYSASQASGKPPPAGRQIVERPVRYTSSSADRNVATHALTASVAAWKQMTPSH